MAAPSLASLGPLDGLLLVDKPSGPTSHDVVAQIRRRFRIPKVGHGGTLDPMATGLLVILLGKGTKISDRVMGHDKTYEGTLRLGDQMQLPPMVSAIKIQGVPLYKLARKGETVERQPRLIHVYRFELLDFAPPDVRFRVECTKGTYVRTLAHDVGQALGVGAHLVALRRTKIGQIDVAQAHPLAELLEAPALDGKVIPLAAALPLLS